MCRDNMLSFQCFCEHNTILNLIKFKVYFLFIYSSLYLMSVCVCECECLCSGMCKWEVRGGHRLSFFIILLLVIWCKVFQWNLGLWTSWAGSKEATVTFLSLPHCELQLQTSLCKDAGIFRWVLELKLCSLCLKTHLSPALSLLFLCFKNIILIV